MKVKINAGRSTLDAIKIVQEVLGVSLKKAHGIVTGGEFECPDEMFTKLNTNLQTGVGGFLEPITKRFRSEGKGNNRVFAGSVRRVGVVHKRERLTDGERGYGIDRILKTKRTCTAP